MYNVQTKQGDVAVPKLPPLSYSTSRRNHEIPLTKSRTADIVAHQSGQLINTTCSLCACVRAWRVETYCRRRNYIDVDVKNPDQVTVVETPKSR